MKNQDFASLARDVQNGKIAPVYFFYGDETYPVDRMVRLITEKTMDPATRDFNFDQFQGEAADGNTIVSAAQSFPMMAEHRLVILKSAQRLSTGDKNRILDYVKAPLDSTCLVICANRVDRRQKFWAELSRHSVWLESKSLYDNQAQDWVIQRFKSLGITGSAEAAGLLVRLVGTSLWSLHFEIEKVLTFCEGKSSISREDIFAVVGLSRDYNLWEFTDTVAGRDLQKSIRILNYLMDTKASPVGVVMDIFRRILLLIRVRLLIDQGLPQNQIERTLGLRPFFGKLYREQCQKFSLDELQKSLKTLLEADRAFKSGILDPKTGLTLVVYDIVSKRKARFFHT